MTDKVGATDVRNKTASPVGAEVLYKHGKAPFVMFAVGLALSLSFIVFALSADFSSRNRVTVEPLSGFTLGHPGEAVFSLDDRTDGDGFVILSGWALRPGETYSYYNYGNDLRGEGVYRNLRIACADDEGNLIIFPTRLCEREPGDAVSETVDTRRAGFVAQVPEQYAGLIDKNGLFAVFTDPDGAKTLYEITEQ